MTYIILRFVYNSSNNLKYLKEKFFVLVDHSRHYINNFHIF